VLAAARVVVVDRSEGSLELARECGADDVILADGGEVEGVGERTDGLGAEAGIDFVGEDGALEDSIAMLHEGGTHYVIGYGEVLSVPAIDIISAEINVVGTWSGPITTWPS
jgi:NAD+-dependent secondary alcohol dehydrogenase Adh1